MRISYSGIRDNGLAGEREKRENIDGARGIMSEEMRCDDEMRWACGKARFQILLKLVEFLCEIQSSKRHAKDKSSK
jgi:hypothetical protein